MTGGPDVLVQFWVTIWINCSTFLRKKEQWKAGNNLCLRAHSIYWSLGKGLAFVFEPMKGVSFLKKTQDCRRFTVSTEPSYGFLTCPLKVHTHNTPCSTHISNLV